MGPRSSKREKQKKRPVRFLLILAMIGALALGFFASPILINIIDLRVGGVTTEINSPWRWFLSFLGKQEDPNQEIPPEPEKPIYPDQAFSVKFSSFSFWRLQLAFSNQKEWAEEEQKRLTEQGIQVHYEDTETGLIMFLGPFLTSGKAEEQVDFAAELGYPDAFPVVWEWPEAESEMVESEDELYTFAKAVTAYNLLANQIFSDQADNQSLNSEIQNLLNTQYVFATEEQEVLWNESLLALQKGVNQAGDIMLLKESIMFRLNDFRNMFLNRAETE
jgi:hypothetical protein